METRVRFAPSPTGQIHIGNIRTAIFNWLYARNQNGKFLLRIEDTDRERSTQDAIDVLLTEMKWLGLDYDEEPLYQHTQLETHLQQAEILLNDNRAYRFAKGEGDQQATLFRIPWHDERITNIRERETATVVLHADVAVKIGQTGISFAQISKKGKPMPVEACLAGFYHLKITNASDECLFSLDDRIDAVLDGTERFVIEKGTKMTFLRREVFFHDIIKGKLSKPLDSMKDFVIVRRDNTPVFHLANVIDDINQGITHIIRGDDHIENTYRHTLLFQALGAKPPHYAHMPMIVNQQGKPYSKRDGDAFVADLREHGFLPDAVFNYLTLLGWSPGDDQEKMAREKIVALFDMKRVQQSPAQMDIKKLTNLNGQYLAEIPEPEFISLASEIVSHQPWGRNFDGGYLSEIATLMQSRTKTLNDIKDWSYFSDYALRFNEKAVQKNLQKPGIREAFNDLSAKFAQLEMDVDSVEHAIYKVTERHEIKTGKLNSPLRVALTGTTIGAGIYEVICLLGRERVIKRLKYACEEFLSGQNTSNPAS